MWLITHLPLFNFFIFLLDEKEGRRSRVVGGGRAPRRRHWVGRHALLLSPALSV